MKSFLRCCAILLIGGSLWAQTETAPRDGVVRVPSMQLNPSRPSRQVVKRPALPSETYGKSIVESAPRIELTAFSQKEMAKFHDDHKAERGRREYIGVNRPVTITTAKTGAWTHPDSAADATLWTLSLLVHGSKGVRVHLQNLQLPPDANLFLYAPEHEDAVQVVSGKGPYGDGELWSPVMDGEEVRFELLNPSGTKTDISLPLFTVVEISDLFADPRVNSNQWEVAGPCIPDATCYADWSESSHAVARILGTEVDGTYACSGVLTNNLTNDGAPFFLTANHCFWSDTVAHTAILYWKYATTTCGQAYVNDYGPTTSGASLLTTTVGYDTTLLQLDQTPPDGTTFAGWNNDLPPLGTAITIIHHPSASWRHIAFGNVAPNNSQFYSSFIGVQWNLGVAEPGSSGSPAYDPSHEIVGLVSRGSSSCAYPYETDLLAPFAFAYPTINDSGNHDYLLKGYPDDKYAPNQTRATAAQLNNLPISDPLVLKAKADDWFKVKMQAGKQLLVTVTGIPDSNTECFWGNDATPITKIQIGSCFAVAATDQDLMIHVIADPRALSHYTLDVKFASYPLPLLLDFSAGEVGPYTARLAGLVNMSGLPGSAWFEFSTDPGLAQPQILDRQTLPASTGPALQTILIEVIPGTTYYFRAVAQNPLGVVSSNVMSFVTPLPVFSAVWSAVSVSFSDLMPGQSFTKSVLLQRQGNVDLSPGFFSAAQPFQVTTQNCSSFSCYVEITFAPTVEGAYSGFITGKIHGYEVSLPISGTAVAALGKPRLAPSSLIFDRLMAGMEEVKTVNLYNDGAGSLSNIAMESLHGPFSTTTDCPASLPSGAHCTFSVHYRPSGYGYFFWSFGLNTSVDSSSYLYVQGLGADPWMVPLRVQRHLGTPPTQNYSPPDPYTPLRPGRGVGHKNSTTSDVLPAFVAPQAATPILPSFLEFLTVVPESDSSVETKSPTDEGKSEEKLKHEKVKPSPAQDEGDAIQD